MRAGTRIDLPVELPAFLLHQWPTRTLSQIKSHVKCAMEHSVVAAPHQQPWDKGRLVGQKHPLKLKEIWAIRIRLQLTKNTRELALLNIALDSKLRGCDLVGLRGRGCPAKRPRLPAHDGASAQNPAAFVVRRTAPFGFSIRSGAESGDLRRYCVVSVHLR